MKRCRLLLLTLTLILCLCAPAQAAELPFLREAEAREDCDLLLEESADGVADFALALLEAPRRADHGAAFYELREDGAFRDDECASVDDIEAYEALRALFSTAVVPREGGYVEFRRTALVGEAREEARLCDICLFYAQTPQDMGWELLSEDGGYWYFACYFYPQGTPTPPPAATSSALPAPSPDIA